MTNIYTPQQQRILLITSLIVIAGFILFGLSGYISAFLGAGILYVVLRPWFTALAVKRNWNRPLVTSLLIIFSLVVIIMPFLTLSLLLIDRIQYYSQHTEDILKSGQKAEPRINRIQIRVSKIFRLSFGRAVRMPVGYYPP